MKRYRICGGSKEPDCQQALSTIIKTATGLEEATVDMETGEIHYSPAHGLDGRDCAAPDSPAPIDENKLRAAVEEAGYALEEIG